MKKIDWAKRLKHLYASSVSEVEIVHVPRMNFLMVDGEGDPNTSRSFGDAIEAFYPLSYTRKSCSCKRGVMNVKMMAVLLTAAVHFCSLSACTGDKPPSDSTTSVGTWKNAALLIDDARSPLIGADGDGNTIAVWQQSGGLYSARFDKNLGWGTSKKIADREREAVFLTDVHLAVNAKGDAIAAWVHIEGIEEFIQTARYTVGSGWSAPQQLTPPNMVFTLDVALDSSSNAFIAWEGLSTNGRNIVVSHACPGSGWDSPQTFGVDNRLAQYPKIAVDGAGSAFVVWVEGEFYPNNVYVNRYSPGTGWSSPQQIATNVGTAARTNIAFDDSGNAMALWNQSDSSDHYHIYSCRYVAGSGWESSVLVDGAALDSTEPALAADERGMFRAVWVQFTGTGKDVYTSRHTAGNGWSTPRIIGTGGTAVSPRVATDGSGNAFATWHQYDPGDVYPGDANVYANHFTVGLDWGKQRQLKNSPGGADSPGLAVDSRGHATVVWSQSVGVISPGVIKYGIYAARFQ